MPPPDPRRAVVYWCRLGLWWKAEEAAAHLAPESNLKARAYIEDRKAEALARLTNEWRATR